MIESAEEFVTLRTSSLPDEYIRAAQEEATICVWIDVMQRYPEMRSWMAHNKSVPIEVLAMLALDPDPDVRSVVADRRKLTPELFRQLSADADEAVRACIAYNKKVPLEVLETLAADPVDIVREAAQICISRRGEALARVHAISVTSFCFRGALRLSPSMTSLKSGYRQPLAEARSRVCGAESG
jgi:hypothetical protein